MATVTGWRYSSLTKVAFRRNRLTWERRKNPFTGRWRGPWKIVKP